MLTPTVAHNMVDTATVPNATVIPIGDAQVSIVGSVITITPTVGFTDEMSWNVTISQGVIEDDGGNPFIGLGQHDTPTLTYIFTVDTIYPLPDHFSPRQA